MRIATSRCGSLFRVTALVSCLTGPSACGGSGGPSAPSPLRNRNGRVELQIDRGGSGAAVAVCPRDFGTVDFNAAHDAALARFPNRGASVCLAGAVQP